MENKEKGELSRVPQYLSFDNTVLQRAYQSDSILLRDIIVYILNKKSKNLFEEYSFSLIEFCREMGYEKTNLQRTKPEFMNVTQRNKNILPVVDNHVFDGIFEHALYRGLKENIIISRKGEKDIEFRSYRVIEELRVEYDRETKKDVKRVYTIKLAKELLENLFKEYFLIDYLDYKSIKASKVSLIGSYRNFYIFMAQMIAVSQKGKDDNYTYIVSVDKLTEVLSLNSEESPRKKKQNIKCILEKLKDIVENTKFNYEFVKNGDRYAYWVEFSFSEGVKNYFNEKSKAIFFKKLWTECEIIFLREVEKINVGSRATGEYIKTKEYRLKFIEWFLSSDMIKDKENLFKKVYYQVYGVHYLKSDISFDDLPC